MAITSANQLELLQTAEAVAREKMIDAELVIQAMEDSLARAAKSRYGAEMDIRVKIDRKTGRASFARIRTVVGDEEMENHHAQLTVKQAKNYLPDPQVGDEVIDEVRYHQERCTFFETVLHFVMWVSILSQIGFLFYWGFFFHYQGLATLPILYVVWGLLLVALMGLIGLKEWFLGLEKK